MLSEFFGIKYKLDINSSVNFDDYMKEIGVGYVTRKIGNNVKPIVELIEEADGKLTLSSKSSFKNVSITFRLNEEFDETTPDGRNVRSLIVQDGNKLIQTQKNGKESTIIREFGPNDLKMTLKAGDITCTRRYLLEK